MKTLLFVPQMHLATFLFVSIETVISIFLLAYLLIRPDDKRITRSLIVIFLLVIFNLTVGLHPDSKLQGSIFIQVIVLLMNIGFLPFFALQIIKAIRTDHEKSKELEQQLRSSRNAVREKDERIKELEKSHEQERNNFIHLLRTEQEKSVELEQQLRNCQNAVKEKDERIKGLEKSHEQERNNYINLVHESNTLLTLPIATILNILQKQQMVQPGLSNVEKNFILYHLTPQETKVAVLLFSEKSYKDIAEKLSISEYTVKKHMQNISDKMRISGMKKEKVMIKLMK